MKLIVGLGNPDRRHEETRHNLGYAVVDALLQEMTPSEKTIWQENKKAKSLIAKVGSLILVKPQVWMNASGFAVRKLVDFYQMKPEDLWVVHDDLDLILGKVKIRKGGGSAGHRGIDSLVQQLGTTDFVRFRLGIGHPGPGSSNQEVESYVLTPFKPKEKKAAKKMIEQAVEMIDFSLEKGIEAAMSRFHQ